MTRPAPFAGPTATTSSKPIEDYAFIGDLHTGALVASDGAIDWLCLPRFDSPACFAALLGSPENGCWTLAPEGAGRCTERRYRGDTMVLETSWTTAQGEVRVLDFMPPRGDAADIVRVVEGVRGQVTMTMNLRLRLDYGDVRPWIRAEGDQTLFVAGPDAFVLVADPPVEVSDGDATSVFTVAPGERVSFVLAYHPSHLARPRAVDADEALTATEEFWQDWIADCTYDGAWQPAVRRALLTLKALTYAPTGGIVAAATTSLPEHLGGVRNWDYRYCWLRDATLTLQSLLHSGFTTEAVRWREWLVRAAAGDPRKLQIMYGLDGSRRLEETTLDWLPGYEGSAPVRIGNAAASQLQIDVWGEVLHGLQTAREEGIEPDKNAWEVQRGLLDWLEGHWQEPDNGLWEMRGDRRHFVHSKVMAWAGVDAAVRAVDRYGLDGPVEKWRALAARIHQDVCERGFNADRGTYTQYYGSAQVDASLLLLPRVGFLPWNDPRILGTIEAVGQDLMTNGLIARYDPHHPESADPLPGGEGAFLACSFWYVDALHATGRTEEARRLFERLLSLRNDVGLLAEEYDTEARRQVGNTPQAFSLVSLVNSAHFLSGTATTTTPPSGT